MMGTYDQWPDEVRRELDRAVAQLPRRPSEAQRRQALARVSLQVRERLVALAITEAQRAKLERQFQAAKSDEEAGAILMDMPLPLPRKV